MSALPVRLFLANKAVISYQNRILILRESSAYQEGTQLGRFDVPGGRMTDEGEQFLDSLRREVQEECGLEIQNIQPFFVNEVRIRRKDEEWQIVRVFYKAEAVSDNVTLSTDHAAYEWIDPKSCKDYPLIENLYPVFDAYNSGNNIITS